MILQEEKEYWGYLRRINKDENILITGFLKVKGDMEPSKDATYFLLSTAPPKNKVKKLNDDNDLDFNPCPFKPKHFEYYPICPLKLSRKK